MPESYYIKILDKTEDWVKKVVPEAMDWRTSLFEDITESWYQNNLC